MEIFGTSSTFVRVQGNRIGTDYISRNDLGNAGDGVRVETPGNTVGGTASAATNTTSGNDGQGVEIVGAAATGNRVLRNSIFDNGSPAGLAVDLGEDGVTANDKKDPDTGPNKLQNFPLITSASTAQIKGILNSHPRKNFTIQSFSNPAPNFPTLFGEGETFLGQNTVRTNKKGKVAFSFVSSASAGRFVTATATDTSGNTSEFSQAREVD